MRVQRVLMPDGSESWTVLDAGGEPVPAVEAFLAHLQALDRSPAIRHEPEVVGAVPGPARRARRPGAIQLPDVTARARSFSCRETGPDLRG